MEIAQQGWQARGRLERQLREGSRVDAVPVGISCVGCERGLMRGWDGWGGMQVSGRCAVSAAYLAKQTRVVLSMLAGASLWP